MNGSRLSKWELAPRACPKTLFEIVGAWDFLKTHRIGLLKKTTVLRTFHTVFDQDFQNGRRYFEHAFNHNSNMTFEISDCALDMCSETLFDMNFLNGRTYFTHISNTSNRAPVLSKWALAAQTCSETLFEIVGALDFFSKTHRIGLLKRTIVLRTFHTVFDHDFQNGRRYFEHAFNNIPNMTFEVSDCALDICSETLFNMNFRNGRTHFTHTFRTRRTGHRYFRNGRLRLRRLRKH